jgi:hypothetical protein
MTQLFTNNAISLLDRPMSINDTVLFVKPEAADKYPNPQNGDYFLVTLEDVTNPMVNEIVRIEQRIDNQLIISHRGYESTEIGMWSADSTLVDHRVTAGTLRNLQTQQAQLPHSTINNVAASQTAPIDSVEMNQMSGTKWIVNISMGAYSNVSEVLGVNSASGPKCIKYGSVGDKLNVDMNVSSSSNQLILSISNNEASEIIVGCRRQ